MTTELMDKYFIDWENETFGYGYGTGEEAIIPVLINFFNLGMYDKTHKVSSYDYKIVEESIGKVPTWLLINIFGHAGIIEYGTSPRYGWLTDKGHKLREYMLSKTVEELLKVLDTDEMYVYCYKNVCNCEEIGNPKCKNPFF